MFLRLQPSTIRPHQTAEQLQESPPDKLRRAHHWHGSAGFNKESFDYFRYELGFGLIFTHDEGRINV